MLKDKDERDTEITDDGMIVPK